jgi:AraC-like DNA-binding protein/quercetin dioxygenase-like cupin family protein
MTTTGLAGIAAKNALKGAVAVNIGMLTRDSKSPDADRSGIRTIHEYATMENQPVFRWLDDLFMVICFATSSLSPVVTALVGTTGQAMKSYVAAFNPGFSLPLHSNNYAQVCYIAQGAYRYTIAGKEEVFRQGEFYYIGRDVPFTGYLEQEDMVVVYLCMANEFFDAKRASEFHKNFINPQGISLVRFLPGSSDKKKAEVLVNAILSECSKGLPGSSPIITGLLERLLYYLQKEYEARITMQTAKDAERQRFDAVCQYLDEHYADASLRSLVELFGRHINYYNRLIRKYSGLGFSQYLQEIRMAKALILLKSSDESVEKIVWKLGYENPSYFYRLFAKKYHLPPAEYRRRVLRHEGSGDASSGQ